jgi:hypothetical protein
MRLNNLVKKDTYRLPDMGRIIEAMVGSRRFSVVDLKKGYYQIEVEKEDEVYEWNGDWI